MTPTAVPVEAFIYCGKHIRYHKRVSNIMGIIPGGDVTMSPNTRVNLHNGTIPLCTDSEWLSRHYEHDISDSGMAAENNSGYDSMVWIHFFGGTERLESDTSSSRRCSGMLSSTSNPVLLTCSIGKREKLCYVTDSNMLGIRKSC